MGQKRREPERHTRHCGLYIVYNTYCGPSNPSPFEVQWYFEGEKIPGGHGASKWQEASHPRLVCAARAPFSWMDFISTILRRNRELLPRVPRSQPRYAVRCALHQQVSSSSAPKTIPSQVWVAAAKIQDRLLGSYNAVAVRNKRRRDAGNGHNNPDNAVAVGANQRPAAGNAQANNPSPSPSSPDDH